MATLAPTLNFWGVLGESRRIVNAHSRHFLALSVFFLLPLSFSLFIYPTLEVTLSQSEAKHTRVLVRGTPDTHKNPALELSLATLALPLTFSLVAAVLYLSAACTITYSTYHGFFGRPVKLASAFKSLVYSFVPLVFTEVLAHFLLALVCVLFGLSVVLVTKAVENLGFAVDYNSNYFLGFCIVVATILVFVLIYLQVKWALAPAIVVAESKWGLGPLHRSAYLVKGMKTVSLYLLFYFGTVMGFFVWGLSGSTSGSFSDVWDCLLFVLQTVLGSSIVTMLMLHKVSSVTVMYIYCKALHGELAWEIAEAFASDYVSLPFNDEKIPPVVFVAQA